MRATMSKRYAYYRMPNGKPYRGDDDKYAPIHLLSEVGRSATVNEQGAVSWSNIFFENLRVALRSAFIVINPDNDELNEQDTWQLIWQSLVELIKKAPGKPVNPEELIKRADELAAVYFRTSPLKYVLLSSLAIPDLPKRSIRVRGCTVTFLKTKDKKYDIPRLLSKQFESSAIFKHIHSTKYRIVRVSTEGRSIYDASVKALDALDLLRGLWSLFATYGPSPLSSGGIGRNPIGVIHRGPIHTLHYPDGKIVDESICWYDPDFTGEHPIFSDVEKWRQIEKERKWAMKQLATHECRSDLEILLSRYVSALDQPNTDLAFLQLWSILEKITDTVGAKYDETIKRTAWIFAKKDRGLVKDILELLRCRRNQYVHSGKASEQCDQIAYLIKFFVDPHIIKLIANKFRIRSIEEYGQLLDLPADVDMLEERQQLLLRALRFLRPKKRA
jgi:hypothetical protein